MPRIPAGGVDIQSDRPHPARLYDYVLGGETHFAADRELAEQMGSVLLGGLDFGRSLARRNRAFMARAVRFLAAEAGIDQYLDIGAGIPAYDNTHELAQAIAPASRVVYVDYDPIVLAHAHERIRSTPAGACDYVHADLRDADGIVARAAATLDLDRPVAVLLVGVLHLVDRDRDPYGVVSRLLDAVPAGSYLALSHFTADIFHEEMTGMAEIYNQAGESMVMRTHAEVAGFFDGLDPVEPGVVLIEDWRPDPADAVREQIPLHGGVAAKT